MNLLNFLSHPSTFAIIAQGIVVLVISVRIIMRRPATGVALAWLLLVAAIPAVGVILYLMVGERRIGATRTKRIADLRKDFDRISEAAIRQGITDVDWSRHSPSAEAMNRLGQNLGAAPTVNGSRCQIYSDTQEILAAITREVESAQTSLLMEFYIWNEGGAADEVLEAVIRAAKRGVSCRLLIDALGARSWWKGKQPQRLREAGVEIRQALPVGIFRSLVGRTDLRDHRKIVVIDGKAAWTGSMNMMDPRFFKQDSGVGQWVDAMVRIEGAGVAPLAAIMIGDWMLETGDALEELIESAGLALIESDGPVDIQVIASGPGQTEDGLLQMILTLINVAREELVLTTPYMVPDESLLRAIRGAAARGVEVSLIVPEKVDSVMTRFASRSYYDDLLDIGVKIFLFRGGLLHTKSIMADGEISMFGTVNLDMRSLWINYEVALFVYDKEFAGELRKLQQSYIDDSDQIDPAQWSKRSFGHRFMENTMRLLGPLL